MRVLTVFGTRPEAIKMAPVVRALADRDGVESLVCVTAQHRQMLDQVISLFGIRVDEDLDLMVPGQSLSSLTSSVLAGVEPILHQLQPDWVLVHGDTTTCMATSLAAFYAKVRIGHVEAGLRTHDLLSPWPEEANRSIVGRLANLHFAPTEQASENLLNEGIDASRVLITGNTVIDALLDTRERLTASGELDDHVNGLLPDLSVAKRLILVTGHRRESFDGGLERICEALLELSKRDDVVIVYPVHLNPVVQKAASSILAHVPNVHLLAPVDYLPFVALMERSYLIITDSGGIQEEAPALGKPVLVTRDTTERPEAVRSGGVALVGTDKDAIVEAATSLLDSRQLYDRMALSRNPYGDGHAAHRIVERLIREHA